VGNRQTIVKYRDSPHSYVQTRLNLSIWHFGCALQWAEGCTSSIVFARWRQCALMTLCRHLSNNTEPSAYGGDAPYVKLLWPRLIFGHAHSDSGTDSQALRAEYCIVGIPHNTAI